MKMLMLGVVPRGVGRRKFVEFFHFSICSKLIYIFLAELRSYLKFIYLIT